MLKNTKSNASGFTLVELLIVIVIIAILAVLTLVGVNGYINRANDSKAKDSAGQLRTKIEAWNSVEGSYPAASDVASGMTTPPTGGQPVDEAKLTDAVKGLLVSGQSSLAAVTSGTGTAPTSLSSNTPLAYAPCSDATKGGVIWYWQKAGNQPIQVGDAC